MPKTSFYLQAQDARLLDELAGEYGSKSEAIRAALAALRSMRIGRALAQKYREEKPLADRAAEIQAETAADLGSYPW
ncbi:hypothetical protein HY522_08710 [bacterium]|nr:hypothetical protein [bacterium]